MGCREVNKKGYRDDGNERAALCAADPLLDLLWRTRFRWKLWPRQVTGDRKYGTEDNLVVIEDQGIRAYIPIPDLDHRTEYFSADQCRYEAERDLYICPAGKKCTVRIFMIPSYSMEYVHLPNLTITLSNEANLHEPKA
jgi:hypothetical protein